MNWRQLTAVVWLRWRIAVNQWRRVSPTFVALVTVFALIGCISVVMLFGASLALGLALFPRATPSDLLFTWNALVVAFLFFWLCGLATELQRGDALSVTTFLHLPMSARGAFLVNYLGSFVRFATIVFLPVALGLGIALAFTHAPWGLAALPLTAAFLLMVTAVTSQFQGWLALMMGNPRRRRTVVAVVTALMVLLGNAPALLSVSQGWPGVTNKLDKIVGWVDAVLPVGWLPLGIEAAADHDPGRLSLTFAGMTLIGLASLARAYRTTIAICQGRATAHGTARRASSAADKTADAAAPRPSWLEWRIPGASDQVAAVALAGLRSLLRAHEVKMMLLTPIALGVLSASWLSRMGGSSPGLGRTLFGVTAIVVSLLTAGGLVGNQFGFDRDGFRAFVLSAVPRRDILLGKNLAAAPFVLGEIAMLLAVVQVLAPLRGDHFLALVPQSLTMYLLTCLLLNVQSILVPVRIDPQRTKPGLPVLAILGNLVVIMILFPLVQLLALGPLFVEALARWAGMLPGVPLFLLLAVVQAAVAVPLYGRGLELQGRLLQAREQRVLEAVTGRAAP